MRAGRRTQVVKGAVCKTAMQRFDPARRLHTALRAWSVSFIWFLWSIWLMNSHGEVFGR
jgi:hypothetical protein